MCTYGLSINNVTNTSSFNGIKKKLHPHFLPSEIVTIPPFPFKKLEDPQKSSDPPPPPPNSLGGRKREAEVNKYLKKVVVDDTDDDDEALGLFTAEDSEKRGMHQLKS